MSQEYRLYPWRLTQLRTAHSSPVPFPEAAISMEFSMGDVMRYPGENIGWRKVRTLSKILSNYLETRFQYKIAAYIIIELIEEIFGAWPEGVTHDAAEMINSALENFEDIVHGEVVPNIAYKRAVLETWWLVVGEFRDNNLDNENNLMRGAYQSVQMIFDYPEIEPLSWYRDQLFDSLWRMYLGVEGEFGVEAADDLMRIWWNRLFSRLAFMQPDEEEE